MRDPPDFASISDTSAYRGEQLRVRPAKEVGFVPRRLHVQAPSDDPTPANRIVTKSFSQRLVTALIRALATWPV
jgi:hypothetical protein